MKKALKGIAFFLMLFLAANVAFAGEIDLLVKKLAEKGIIDYGEAQTILTETKEEVRKEIAQGKSESLPQWVQKINLKGDFRLRYQSEKKDGSTSRDRFRYRFRLKSTAKVTEGFEAGFGLATGGTDPRSTNQTMQNSFETPDIRLDYAYGKWTPLSGLDIYGGKFANMFKKPGSTSDLLWDGDINIEGLAIAYSQGKTGFFFHLGYLILDEWSSSTSDPYLIAVQPGYKFNLGEIASAQVGVAYYAFSNVKGAALDHSEGGNSLVEQGSGENITEVLKHEYKCWSPSVKVNFDSPFGGIVERFSIFADYVKNNDPSDKNTGYLGGLSFGAKKIKNAGDWQVKYMYRKLEADAWLDIFPDSDAYSGATGIKGSEVILNVGLAKDVSFGIDYYDIQQISSGKHKKIWQFDISLKF